MKTYDERKLKLHFDSLNPITYSKYVKNETKLSPIPSPTLKGKKRGVKKVSSNYCLEINSNFRAGNEIYLFPSLTAL